MGALVKRQRKFILGVAAHPFRAVWVCAGSGAALGIVFFLLTTLMDGGVGTLNSDVGGWMRWMVNTFGETGGDLAIDVAMWVALCLMLTPWLWALAWFAARQERMQGSAETPAS